MRCGGGFTERQGRMRRGGGGLFREEGEGRERKRRRMRMRFGREDFRKVGVPLRHIGFSNFLRCAVRKNVPLEWKLLGVSLYYSLMKSPFAMPLK